MEIIQNGEQVWKGTILRGCGNNVFDYETTIDLGPMSVNPEPVNEQLIPTKEVPEEKPTNELVNVSFSKPVTLGNLSSRRLSSATKETQEEKKPTPVEKPKLERNNSGSSGNLLIDAYKQARPDEVPIWLGAKKEESNSKPNSRPSSGTKDAVDASVEFTTDDLLRDLDRETSVTIPRQNSARRLKRANSAASEEDSPLPRLNSGDSTRAPNSAGRTSRPGSGSSIDQVVRPPRPRSRQESPLVEPKEETVVPKPMSKESSRVRTMMDESFDSLMHFKTHHAGMLKGRDSDDEEDESDSDEEYEIISRPPSMKQIPSQPILPHSATAPVNKWKQRAQEMPTIAPSPTLQEEETFEIPMLPHGKEIYINILTSWGDPHYMGLNGIEIFDKRGELVKLNDVKKQVRANPADINILPEYHNDPRTIDKLFDRVNRTCDDMHVWLTPFTKGKKHEIFISLNEPTTISMIRIWVSVLLQI
jgi:hypothetical protein